MFRLHSIDQKLNEISCSFFFSLLGSAVSSPEANSQLFLDNLCTSPIRSKMFNSFVHQYNKSLDIYENYLESSFFYQNFSFLLRIISKFFEEDGNLLSNWHLYFSKI